MSIIVHPYWTPAEIAMLQECHANGWKVIDIAQYFGRSRNSIWRIIWRIRVAEKAGKPVVLGQYRSWPPKDIEALRAGLADGNSYAAIGRLLGRSAKSIAAAKHRYNFGCRPPPVTQVIVPAPVKVPVVVFAPAPVTYDTGEIARFDDECDLHLRDLRSSGRMARATKSAEAMRRSA